MCLYPLLNYTGHWYFLPIIVNINECAISSWQTFVLCSISINIDSIHTVRVN